MDINQQRKANGQRFGYPSCCIEHFIDNCNTPYWFYNSNYDQRFVGTGYVPCPSCTAKVKDLPINRASVILLGRDIFTNPMEL